MPSNNFNRLLQQDFSDLKAAGRGWQKVSKETAVQRMEQAQKKLRAAVNGAEAQGFPVSDDGVVGLGEEWGDRGRYFGGDDYFDRLEAQAEADKFQDPINEAIDDALAASFDASKALAELDGDILDRTNAMAAESANDVDKVMDRMGVDGPRIPKNPKDAAKWWQGLSPEQQQEYATLYPDRIGSTDGLPSDVRNDSNRLALEQDASALSMRDPSIDGYAEHRRNVEALRAALAKQDGAPEGKQLYLLDYDAAADGKAVIAMGNPDTADNVGVQVPGTDTTMASTSEQLDRIGRLQDSANNADTSADTAMVYWLGYDAPEVPGVGANNLDVAGPGRAEAASQDLRNFTHGLRASHEGERANLTVLGHSYGSTVVGAAASEGGGLDADNIAVVGSPGMLVNGADDLNIDPDHFYVGQAATDPIEVVQGETLGIGPDTPGFGGTQFRTDTSGHTGY